MRKINRVITVLISSDFVLNSGWGLLGPVFAIFILQRIAVGDVTEGAKIAGFSSLVYWAVKSFLQIPIGSYLDKKLGEKDDFYFMVLGTFLAGLTPFGYLFSSLARHIYGLQILQAIGMALAVPSWSALFTRHIDKGKEAFEWSVRSTSLGLGVGVAGAVGGVLVSLFGFEILFILVGFFTMLSVLLLFFIQEDLSLKDKSSPEAYLPKDTFYDK